MVSDADSDVRTTLLALRADLHALDNSTAESRAPVSLDQTTQGRLSRMDALQRQAMDQAVARRRHQHIARINAALERLETGDYGFCLGCGEAIDAARLSFDPAVTQCVTCAATR